MKADRLFVAVNGLVAAGLGFWLAAMGEPLPAGAAEWAPVATLRLAGVGLAGLGLAFGILGDPGTTEDRQWFASLLLVGDVILVSLLAWHNSGSKTDWRSLLCVVILMLLALGLSFVDGKRRLVLARLLFSANAVALFVLGTSAYILEVGLIPAREGNQTAAFDVNIAALGTGFGFFGLALLGLLSLSSWRARARLCLGLAAGNAVCAAVIAAQQVAIWGLAWTKSLVFLFVVLTVAGLWVGLRLFQNLQDTGPARSSSLTSWLMASHLAVAGVVALGLFYLQAPAGLGLALGVAAGAGLAMSFFFQRQVSWAEGALSSLVAGEPTPRRPRGMAGPMAGLASAIQSLIPNVQAAGDVRRGWLRRLGEAAAQEERNRLARDLHDSIKQQLFSINVGAAAAEERWDSDPQGARAAVADVRQSAQAAMGEMKALLLQLRPEALASVGLVAALREQCEALHYRTGAQVVCDLGEALPDAELPPGAQEAIFRVAQEALGNVARHARARKVRLSLRGGQGRAVLEVEDDGQGFDPVRLRAGMGISNMRERAASVSGTLEIESTPNQRTKVTLRVPFTKRAEITPVRLLKALRFERLTTAVALLTGVPILLDLWGIVRMVSRLAEIAPMAVFFLQTAHLGRDAFRPGASPTTFSELRLHLASTRAHRALSLGLVWWGLWNLESGPPGRFDAWSGLLALLGLGGFLIALGQTTKISGWRPARPVPSVPILLGAAGIVILPLSMIALAPVQGIFVSLAIVFELYLFACEPRMPEPAP